MSEWSVDVLGAGFECQTLQLGADEEGPLVATLVRSLAKRRTFMQTLLETKRDFEGVDVLYVHGWSDYFFQTELASFFTKRGADFYALDLRKYGRSFRDYQTPGYIDDLQQYDVEINQSLAIIRAASNRKRKLVLLGHSTGGLILSLWASRNRDAYDFLVLNSPWLEFQLTATARKALKPLLDVTARWHPEDPVPQIDFGYYTRAQHEVADEQHPLIVNEHWRPSASLPVRPGWLKAVLDGHAQIEGGLSLEKPICMLLSQRFEMPTKWSEALKHADSVINVDEVAKAALHLGSDLTVLRIDNALHDVFLSLPEVRETAYDQMYRWLVGVLYAQNR